MTAVYNFAMRLVWLLCRTVWASEWLQRHIGKRWPKVLRLVMGQQGQFDSIASQLAKLADGQVCWIHAASYGEYNVIRPVVQRLRGEGCHIMLTFFSPSGYEVLTERNRTTAEVDLVAYLPLDTPANVRRFLDIVRPVKAVFVISEYWLNYLRALRKRNIDTYFVSMRVAADSYILKWYGSLIRRELKACRMLMVTEEQSARNLRNVGIERVLVTGDPLFDNAVATAREEYHDETIERFIAGTDGVLVAGSISDDKDLSLVAALANKHRDLRIIIVPHELGEESLSQIERSLEGRSIRYSACKPDTDLRDIQVLVADLMGVLARIYRYGRWAYVGGGFTPYLHSVIEPAVYGLPVAFGPRFGRQRATTELLEIGVGKTVETPADLIAWMERLRADESLMAQIRQKALDFVERNAKAARIVAQEILK